MSRPTDAACPVCAEPLRGGPERCFRCQTALTRWWAFEDALRALGPGGAPPPRGASWVRMLAVAFLGAARGAAGVMARRPAPRPAALPAPVPTPPPLLPPPPEVLTYRVQRGDSLWRIASAVTGDGRRWRELWPEHRDGEGRLLAGTVLRLDLSRLEGRAETERH
jgi:hypothetical protein